MGQVQEWEGNFFVMQICILTYARLQGLNSLIDHFENSKVLNSKDKKYRPIIKPNAKIHNLIRTQQQQWFRSKNKPTDQSKDGPSNDFLFQYFLFSNTQFNPNTQFTNVYFYE